MAENDSCIKRSAIILTAFGLFFVTWYFNLGVRPFANFISTCKSIHYILNYLIAGIIPAAALLLLHRPDTILYRLGLTHGFGRGLLFGVLSTVPMFAGYAVIGSFNRETPPDHMFTFIVVAGFFEELIFRGFVFGELFRTARWGFLPAATLTALAFGSLHLYQGDDLISASAAFGVTAAGSIFFSWIYVESENNLWSVIWLQYADERAVDAIQRERERRSRRIAGERPPSVHAADRNRISRHIQETEGTTLPYFRKNTDNQQTICIKNSFSYLLQR